MCADIARGERPELLPSRSHAAFFFVRLRRVFSAPALRVAATSGGKPTCLIESLMSSQATRRRSRSSGEIVDRLASAYCISAAMRQISATGSGGGREPFALPVVTVLD